MTARVIVWIAAILIFGSTPRGLAAGPENFQHAGRGTAQVGALTARAGCLGLDLQPRGYRPSAGVAGAGWS